MSTKLPEPLATYFAGHKDHDVDAMIGPFAEGATVKDEGQERRGLPAIRKWMEESNAKYTSPSQSSTSSRWPQTQPSQAVFLGTSQVAPSSYASSSPSTKGRLPVWRLSNGYARLLDRSERVCYQARSRHRWHERHGPGHRSATYCRWCEGCDHRTLAVARRSEGRILCPGRRRHSGGRREGRRRSSEPFRGRGHPRQLCRRIFCAGRRRARSQRRGLAADNQHQPVRRRPPLPPAAARNAETRIGRYHPHLLHPTAFAAVRSDARLCSRQGGPDDLQQRPLKGGRAERHSSKHSRARLY